MKPNLFAGSQLAPVFRECAFCLWDVGARGGVDPIFAPFAFAIDAVGFEPDPPAFAELSSSGRWRSEKFFETALGGPDTGSTLNITSDPAGASFLKHDVAIGVRYGLDDLFQVRRTVEIPTVTIDHAMAELGVPAPTLLKLDVEGLELDILKGAAEALKGVVAIKLEAGFMRHRFGQPLVGEVIAFLECHGLYAVDLVDQMRWRKRPWAGDPYSVKGTPPYSRGRLAQADIIFLREPRTITPGMARPAALAAIGLGYFDHGLELLREGSDEDDNFLQNAISIASKLYARARGRQELRDSIIHISRLVRSLTVGLNVPPRNS
ncbi:MAG: FkbM family methyltransferase [Pseudomonadota bacterium]|nr:FkbM family methyltransferase [Pseudomonadota bacterium]